MSKAPVNHLIHENSPYLQQHAHNPVEWYPWGETALDKARTENKPILLSIGYAACHWCHVMAHESFEDEETAALMNQLFVNIKVDKEERPDLDKIYQTSHYYLSQQSGGWPLTIFLTPDLTPFFSGTYFPLEDRYQLPSFKKVLNITSYLYKNRTEDIRKQGMELKRILQQQNKTFSLSLNPQPLELAFTMLEQNYDEKYGGFGTAPKFPQASKLEYLLSNRSPLAAETLKKIAKGGIYDQLRGGFYRYSVDQKWNIPHFEKMLYDNGQLLTLYSLASRAYPQSSFKKILTETAEWVIAEMQSAEGGYFSSLDADSEGEEGKFYYWDKSEIQALLTAQEYTVASLYFGLNNPANFENHWHLYISQPLKSVSRTLNMPLVDVKELIASAKRKLLWARNKRSTPFRDEKILTSWNALMIKGMLLAGKRLNQEKYLHSAYQALDFVQSKLWDGEKLQACYKNGDAYLLGYLDDYVFLLDALLTSLEVSWNTDHLLFTIELAEAILAHFSDETVGGFFFTANNHEKLLYRPKTMMDDAIPAGNGVLVRTLLILGHLLGEIRYIEAAEQTLKAAWTMLSRYPAEHCSLLLGLQTYLTPPQIIVIRGQEDEIQRWQALAKSFNNYVVAIPSHVSHLPEVLAAKKAQGDCCAYVCQGHECKEVIKAFDDLKRALIKEPTSS
ncbi:Thioredoxin-related protein [Legionella lansingensis]|uniref:Spermatogenesis-associated protein 20-like TRX domain-containing protein n=1 Tax=Legionella lansingensis TaxID=45067 RepID=A0A0W0VTC1_9GAMM|nr:thioredoxin domain-containing protein [Legionella lansingensis]KTD23372.1 hypothetical protein Llan_0871 [Legionella lansingensis]SNV49434.1 Thioredoxin-related protein [Legionella lansingensis]